MVNRWIQVLKRKNAGKPRFCVPRKGTKSHRNALKAMRSPRRRVYRP